MKDSERIPITPELREKLEVLFLHYPTCELVKLLGFKSDSSLKKILRGKTRTVSIERFRIIEKLFRELEKE